MGEQRRVLRRVTGSCQKANARSGGALEQGHGAPFEPVTQLGDALCSVGAAAILVKAAKPVVGQTATREGEMSMGAATNTPAGCHKRERAPSHPYPYPYPALALGLGLALALALPMPLPVPLPLPLPLPYCPYPYPYPCPCPYPTAPKPNPSPNPSEESRLRSVC